MRAVQAGLDRRASLRIEPLQGLQAFENFRDLVLTQAGGLGRKHRATVLGKSGGLGLDISARQRLALGRGRWLLIIVTSILRRRRRRMLRRATRTY
jgi:hypothetical protein